jgi:hypothetical protein
MRALITSLIVLGAVVGGVRAYALNPQPLPPGMRYERSFLNPQPLPPLEAARFGRPVAPPHHIIVPKCPPGVHCLY